MPSVPQIPIVQFSWINVVFFCFSSRSSYKTQHSRLSSCMYVYNMFQVSRMSTLRWWISLLYFASVTSISVCGFVGTINVPLFIEFFFQQKWICTILFLKMGQRELCYNWRFLRSEIQVFLIEFIHKNKIKNIIL